MVTGDGHDVSERWSQWRAETDLQEYFTRWQRLEATGQSPHGEADFIESFHPRSVLDAGCGMGRVAIELHRRGIDVVGVDLDDDLLQFARRSEPSIRWVRLDLATMSLDREFDVVAMPGNVMVYLPPHRSRHGHPTCCGAHRRRWPPGDGFRSAGGSGRAHARRIRPAVLGRRPRTGAALLDVAGRRVPR